MKNFLKIVLFIFLFSSCVAAYQKPENKIPDSPGFKSYSGFIKGFKSVIPGATNNLSVNEKFYIELKTSAVPYLWDYSFDNTNINYIDEDSFDLNPAGMAGAPVRYIWRFECIKSGMTVITYYYRSIVKRDVVVKTNIYTLVIQ